MIALLVIASLVVRLFTPLPLNFATSRMEYPLRSKHITSLYSAFTCSSLFSKRLEHLGDALFLLFHVRVNIEIKGCCNIGMTEQYAYGLVVAVAFNAACRKVVMRSVPLIR